MSYLKDTYTQERQAKGFENVPAPVWGAMQGQAGDVFAAWQQRLKEQAEKVLRDEEKRKVKEVEEEKLRAVKVQCFYNIRKKAQQQLEMTDASVTMIEE